jgi:hypothetical protein
MRTTSDGMCSKESGIESNRMLMATTPAQK